MEKRGKARKPKELCGKKQRHRNKFISVRKSCGNPAEKREKARKPNRELCGKNRGIEMSLFLYGNPVEILRKSAEKRGNLVL